MKTLSARNEPAADAAVLVDAAWLAAHLHDPALRVVEVDVSQRAHDAWHIEGAVLWDVYRDLKDADYRLIGTEATMSLLASSGIEPDTTVVFHGYAPALGFWLMKLHGHQDARILDCSRDAWPVRRAGAGRADHVLHDRRPRLHRLVRPDLPARPRARPGLRRLVGRMGPDARCSGRTGLTAYGPAARCWFSS